MSSKIDIDQAEYEVHGVPIMQSYFHVYNLNWRRRSQGVVDWRESNLLDRFIDLLRLKPHTRKQLGYIALSNGYPRVVVSECLDLLLLLEYIELQDGMYVYTLPKNINPEDVW
jgi:hypothetical protein